MISFQTCTQMLDASMICNIDNTKQLQQMPITLLAGNTFKIFLTVLAVTQMTKMMLSCLRLLISIFTNRIPEPKNWTQLLDRTKVATKGLEKGKIKA